jgi:hypothetical protein
VKNIVGKNCASVKRIESDASMRDACGQAICPAFFTLVESNPEG